MRMINANTLYYLIIINKNKLFLNFWFQLMMKCFNNKRSMLALVIKNNKMFLLILKKCILNNKIISLGYFG